MESEVTIEKLLAQQALQLKEFFARIDSRALQPLVDLITNCNGSLFLLGVGKSGAIARKLASTFVSTGTKAHYLSVTNALHGDIGCIEAHDVILFLSKSGESDELLSLPGPLRIKGAFLAALVANKKSRLAKAVDLAVEFPFDGELSPFQMIPTTSSTIQLIIGDVIALSVMQARGLTLEQFAHNHPAGQLGKRLTLRVSDLMLTGTQVPAVPPHVVLSEGLLELTHKRCGCLLVLGSENELLGILTDGDLRRHLQKLGPVALERPLRDLMNVHPRTIGPSVGAYQALLEMEKGAPITEVPVVSAQKVIGLLKMHDLLRSGL